MVPSPLFVSFTRTIDSLREHLIATGKDYNSYTAAEHSQALGFRVLASAHIEQFAEQRCLDVATASIQRVRTRRPSRAGYALLTWHCVRKQLLIPVSSGDFTFDERFEASLEAYRRFVKGKHGIGPNTLVSLVTPLGVGEVNQQLLDQLESLAVARGEAAHIRINRAKSMAEPNKEWLDVQETLRLLEPLDAALTQVEAQPP